jgi:phage-related protein
MPKATLKVFREKNGEIPVEIWLEVLERKVPLAYAKMLAAIQYVEQLGYEAERPQSGTLEQGIYEVRAKERKIHYRVLYFFQGRNVICLSHGIIKQTDRVPPKDIAKAVARMKLVEHDPSTYLADWTLVNGNVEDDENN